MHQLTQIPGRTARTKDKEYLYFSGTNYLGMGQLPEFQTYVQKGIESYGLNFGGSRLSNVRFDIFEQVEAYLAGLGKAEAALTVSSGTLAGQLVVKYFEKKGELHYAPESHPALWSPIGKNYTEREAWIDTIITLSHQPGPPIIVLSNALDPLHVRLFDFKWLKQLNQAREIIVVIDDSHAWGITGIDGGGTYSSLELQSNVELVVLGSLGKAFGIPAGFVLASKPHIKAFWHNPFFGGASPTLPAFLYAMVNSQALYQKQRRKLFANVRAFQKEIKALDFFNFSTEYPVFHTSANTLADYLLQHDVMISSFPYPSPESDLITRIVINALHTPEDIEDLVEWVQRFFMQNTGH